MKSHVRVSLRWLQASQLAASKEARTAQPSCRLHLGARATIGILCRNHRAPLIASFAASRLGANAVWLNTSFSARQVREVAEREGVDLLVHDAEFSDAVSESPRPTESSSAPRTPPKRTTCAA